MARHNLLERLRQHVLDQNPINEWVAVQFLWDKRLLRGHAIQLTDGTVLVQLDLNGLRLFKLELNRFIDLSVGPHDSGLNYELTLGDEYTVPEIECYSYPFNESRPFFKRRVEHQFQIKRKY